MELDLGGRKFIFALIVLVMFFIAAYTGKIPFTQFESGAVWALGIFVAGNTISKFADITITKTGGE